MAFLEVIKETFESGDPTVRTWAMVRSWWTPFICVIAYIFFVKRLGPDLMRNRKPFDLRLAMIFYNFSLVITYAACLLILIYYLLTTAGVRSFCTPHVVSVNDWTYTCTAVGWIIYLLKYVEFLDTVFFVLRKKDHLVTNLHVIHHSVLPILGWIALRTETTGFQFIPAGINSFLHVCMYSYYGLAAMGPEVKKYLWWKRHLTQLQMAQFLLILFLTFVIYPLSGCTTSLHGIFTDIFFAILFFALFYNYYIKTYYKKKAPAKHEPVTNGHHIPNGHQRNTGLKQS